MIKNETYNALYKEIVDMLGNSESMNVNRLHDLIEEQGILPVYKALIKPTLLSENEKCLIRMFQSLTHHDQKEVLDFFNTYGFDCVLYDTGRLKLTNMEKKALETFHAFPENLKIEVICILRTIEKLIK